MAAAVATPLEKQFSTIAGLDQMTSSSTQGSTQHHAAVHARPRHRRGGRRTCRRRSPRRCASCRRASCRPRYQKVNPADAPILYLALTSPHAAAVDARRVRRDVPGAAHLDGGGRGAGAGVRLAEVRRADPAWTRARWPPAAIGIDEVANAINNANVNLPTGILWGAHQAFTVQANGQLEDAEGFRADDRGVPQRLAGAAGGHRAASSTASRTTSRRAGSTARAASCSRSSASPAPTPSQVASDVKALLPKLADAAPGVGAAPDLCTTARTSIRDSVNDVKGTLLLTLCLVVMVIFLFLRNISATVIPSLALPMSIVGHVRRRCTCSATASTTSR